MLAGSGKNINGSVKSFCVPLDLLLVKLAACGVDDNLYFNDFNMITYNFSIHFYPLNRKQCVCINNILSEFNKVVSGVPQGSIVGPILFNCFFNDFYLLRMLVYITL